MEEYISSNTKYRTLNTKYRTLNKTLNISLLWIFEQFKELYVYIYIYKYRYILCIFICI